MESEHGHERAARPRCHERVACDLFCGRCTAPPRSAPPATEADADAPERLFQVSPAGTAVVRHPARRHRLNRIGQMGLVAGACVIALSAVIAGGVWIGSATVADWPAKPTPIHSSTAAGVVTLPGFHTHPSWAGRADAMAVVVSADGKLIGQSTGSAVTVTDQAGTKPVTVALDKARLVSGVVGGKKCVVAISGRTAAVFSAPGVKPVEVPLPASPRLVPRGAGVFVLSRADRSNIGVLDAGGITPVVSPSMDAMPAWILPGGGVQWVSASGQLFRASAAGTQAASSQLEPPIPGLRVNRALAGGKVIVTVWSAPNGSAILATHSSATGAIIGRHAVASVKGLIFSPSGESAMSGSIRISMTSGTLTVPDSTFQATTALSDGVFFGGAGASVAVQDASCVTQLIPNPHVRPAGVTAGGALVGLLNGRAAAVFSKDPTVDAVSSPRCSSAQVRVRQPSLHDDTDTGRLDGGGEVDDDEGTGLPASAPRKARPSRLRL